MTLSAADLRPAAVTSYDVVRLILGLILLTAALLKGHQLATEPVPETGLLTSRWFLICVVEFEFFFGLWLSFGPYPRQTRQLALLCFSAFGCVALYKALTGEATCGCFGRVPVNPWYTLILDLAAVLALICCQPARGIATSPLPLAGEGPGVRAGPRRQLACVLGISLLVGLPAALLMASYQAATLDESGDIFGDSEFVILEPEKWVGKRFPLLKHIDIEDRLAEGGWIVLFYHHDCSKCWEAIPRYEELAQVWAVYSRAPRVALVEMPPYGASGEELASDDSSCFLGRLCNVRKWLLGTPTVVVLEEGNVIATRGPNWAGGLRRVSAGS